MAEQKKRSGARSLRKPSSISKSSTSSKTSTSVKSKESAEKKGRRELNASSATGGSVALPSPAPILYLTERKTPVVPLEPVETAEPRLQSVKQPVKKAVTIEEQAVEAIATGGAPAKATDVQYRAMVIVPLVVLSTLLLIILVALFQYVMSQGPAAPQNVALCRTPDCAQFGREVSAAIDPTIHPCHDFHAFVCGGSNQPKHRQSTESRMIADAYDMELKEVKGDVKRVGKVTQFFRSCIRAGTHKNENLRQFAELRRNLSLSWPEMKPTGAHPLEVMVNLALNWQMNFLFDMDVATVRQFPAILFTRGRLDYGWQQRERDPPKLEDYEDYVDTYYGILDVNVSRIDIKASELLTIERAIVHAKMAFMYDAPQQEWFTLRALDKKTSSLPSGLWLSVLKKHDNQFSWKSDDIAIAEDVRIFANIDNLSRTYSEEKLMIGFSWIFIQTHLWAASGEPFLRFRGERTERQLFWERGCMAYAESRLGLLTLSKALYDLYGRIENRRYIDSIVLRIKENTKRLVKNLTWMDEQGKGVAFRKLDAMTHLILPGEIYFSRKKLEQLYDVFPDMTGKTFMTNLVETTRLYRKLRKHKHFQDVYSVRAFPRFGRELYLHLPNALVLATGVLNPPLFYSNGTLAMKYGGMASLAARQMAKSLDEVGVTVNDKGKSGIWLTPKAAAMHAKKAGCDVHASPINGSRRPMSVFPFIPGIEIAYQSYTAAVEVDYLKLDDYRVVHLESFSDKQVFFITYCYALCAHGQQSMGDECNVPVKNMPQFAAAYRCPPGSPMNPPRKCTFFY